MRAGPRRKTRHIYVYFQSKYTITTMLLSAQVLLHVAAAPLGSAEDPFGWIRAIEAGPTGQKIALNASTYLIDQQYQFYQH